MKRSIWFLFFVVWAVISAGCVSSGSTSQNYQVTGRVVDENGDGIEGVTLTVKGGSTSTVSTDEDGKWVATARGIATVHPDKEGYAFSPKTVTITKQNAQGDFRGVTGKMVGRVVIKGQSPEREVKVRIRSSGEEREILTRSNGEFEIPLNEHQGDTIRIMTASFDSFDVDEQVEYGLHPWFNIDRVPLEAAFLPDIDLHGYGLRLLEPNHGETVSLPYQGRISLYDRDVNITYYRLYFYDTERNALGNSDMTFTSDLYTFDGLLQNGNVLDRDAVWYLAVLLEQDGFSLSVTTPGKTVNYSDWGADASALSLGGDNSDFPAMENYVR